MPAPTHTMRRTRLKSVPSLAAELYLDPSEYTTLPGILLGNVPEVDLESLRTSDPGLADELERYYLSAVDLWYRDAYEGDTITVKYPLVQALQKDTKDGKVLLRQELLDLVECPATKAVSDLLTKEPKDLRAPRHSGYDLKKENGVYTATFVDTRQTWPKTMGGPKHPGEKERHIKVSFIYAKWRDSKVKKLTGLTVEVVEVWPRPPRVPAKAGL